MPGPRKAEIHRQARLFDDFFKVDEVMVSHERADGTMSPDQRRLIFERGDAVAALLYNPDTNAVVMVNQFKVPCLVARRRDNPLTTDGWVTETIAGMIDPGETPEEAIVRETREETGYKIHDPALICRFFSSPGGTSERIFLYFAEVRDADRIGKGGGVDGEDIRVVHKSAHELLDQLAKKQIEDPKLAIAASWLRDQIRGAKALHPSTVKFAVKEKPELIVGYKTGSIEDVKGVSIWVNSENTDMMMDRFLGRTISAKIRYLGANKEEETVSDDTIQESLRGVVGERAHVRIGTVLVTESGMLLGTHKVERIFHVATVEGGPGTGVKADLEKLRMCVDHVLSRADQENNRLWRIVLEKLRACVERVLRRAEEGNNALGRILRKRISRKRIPRKKYLTSIVFPMLGAGDGGLSVESVAENIIPVAINYLLRDDPPPTVKEIYFLAFRSPDSSACHRVLEGYCAKGVLTRLGSG